MGVKKLATLNGNATGGLNYACRQRREYIRLDRQLGEDFPSLKVPEWAGRIPASWSRSRGMSSPAIPATPNVMTFDSDGNLLSTWQGEFADAHGHHHRQRRRHRVPMDSRQRLQEEPPPRLWLPAGRRRRFWAGLQNHSGRADRHDAGHTLPTPPMRPPATHPPPLP